MIWFNDHMQGRIDNALIDSQFVKAFNITFGRSGRTQGSDIVNELLGRILMQDIHPEGFKQITLKGFEHANDNSLDEGLLQRIANQS